MKRGIYWDKNPLEYKNTVDALVYDLTKKKALQVYELCVQLSPVLTGGYRASWRLTEGTPENFYVGRQPLGMVLPPPSPPTKLSNLFYRKFYVSNGAPYAPLIENGLSDQAPAGVMNVAVKLAGKI